MRIYVCVKQVPDTSGKVAVNENGTLNRASMDTIVNPDDLNAVEAALELKDELGCQVTVVTMGPPPAKAMLRELLAMGADDAVLISGREFGGSDTFATSQIIAGALHNLGVGDEDIVFCGRQAIDGDTAQVGPQIAEKLGIPQVTYAGNIQKDGNKLVVKRLLEDGYMVVEVFTPCLITCVKELNEPRYMTVKNIIESENKPILVLDYEALKDEELIDLDSIGLKGSPTNIFKSFTPPQKGEGVVYSDSVEVMSKKLTEDLVKKHIV
ncbi:MAG: electron transfer flavoprotein subunit beta/FixA family protein [Lachnospiraceae bacterium]|nr:electron transfer flavoprotein subunit beta/FixA family protein [Lachnospiraceae bacterium]